MQEKIGVRVVDAAGQPVNLPDLLAEVTRERKRVLLNDALGLLVDVSDRELYTFAADPETGQLRRARINRIAKAKTPITYWSLNMPESTVTDEDITLFIQEKRGTTKLVQAEGTTKQIHTDATGRLRITMLTPAQLVAVGETSFN